MPANPIGTVAIIGGTGRLGMGLARRLAKSGVPIVIGSRDAAKARAAAQSLVGNVRGAVNDDAAEAADFIIIAVPYEAHRTTLESLAAAVAGKVVVDTAVPVEFAGGLRVNRVQAGSLAQETAQILSGAKVAAAFHTVSAPMLSDVSRPPHGDVLICGDEPAAKEAAATLARAIGMRPVDVGGLAGAHALEQLAGLLLVMNRRYRRRDLGITIAGL